MRIGRLVGCWRAFMGSPFGAVLSELSEPSRPDVLAWLAVLSVASSPPVATSSAAARACGIPPGCTNTSLPRPDDVSMTSTDDPSENPDRWSGVRPPELAASLDTLRLEPDVPVTSVLPDRS
ncbi:hypothetical protein TIFTF001_031344 [Ficus carica]|uniref:Uncharacterized protein n=1 Tax=Ficus carica TaxID=3494 RepID=A0AA88DUT6_FICCA|nr:hypothetical protein TIFTF001_031344 [Ficus carica]